MKKITVVGGGNAGCFTALYCAWMDKQKDFEVELIYDPEIPPERVGQATILEASALLWACLLYTSPSPRDRQKSRMPSSA